MGVHPLLREPWAITADGLRLAVGVGSRGEYFDATRQSALAARNGRPLENARCVELRGNVAVIPIEGTMFRHADLLQEISGGVSYATLRKDLQTTLDNDAVQGIVLAIDSPGGEVNGLAELAASIYDARAVKPIAAYVSGAACSAAYWLAAAADRVVCSPTAQLGSIGILTAFINDDAAKKERAETIEIRSSGAPNKNPDPTTEAGRDLIQERLDAVESVFHAAVALYRGVDVKTVAEKFGRGDVRVGADAVALKMADAIGSYESTISDVSQRGAAAQTKRMLMEKEQERVAALVAFEREVLAIAGKASHGEALGALRAMVSSSEKVSELIAQLEQARVDKRLACFDALVKQGRDAHQISPAMAKSDWLGKMRGREDGCDDLTAFLAFAPKLVSDAKDAPREDARAGDVEITAAEIEVAKNLVGNDPEKIKAHLDQLKTYKAERAQRAAGRV